MTALASKAAQSDNTHSLFKVQPIQIPPRDYQDKVIAVIDEIHAETQHLTRLYERKLAALEELKKALLHQAFNGKL
jgi:type I restriction enzyme S subunit